MRRSDKEITDRDEISDILTSVMTGRLGTCADDIPYIVPMNFAYDRETCRIFLHCANEGKKLENIKVNRNVCFEVEEVARVIVKEPTCASSVAYRSVILFGTVKALLDLGAKDRALQKLAEKYAPQNLKAPFTDAMLKRTHVLEIEIREITAKRSPAKKAITNPSEK
ncbi:MAG: pyridoxamine 5'-phosphate oxidase family protein [Candidatus Brocadiaceae bacterium]|nr:pyridoxamine 5'-phosphate oxidase family protein [Candidatus Brocadiaceae bacterium]